ncbi:hypothetical protein WDU94_011419, partial [Cyamophila willieti]
SCSQSDPNTSFLRAARAGHLEKLRELLESGVDINTSNANGLNALHLAAKDGHTTVVKALLKGGCKVDASTKKGNTALHIAALGKLPMVMVSLFFKKKKKKKKKQALVVQNFVSGRYF